VSLENLLIFQVLNVIVCNLLSNSIKFTPIGGRVEIRVACSESSAQFQVIDTGIGIKPELLPYRTHLTSLQLGIKVLTPLESNPYGVFQRLDR
jgi:hypothetical protein